MGEIRSSPKFPSGSVPHRMQTALRARGIWRSPCRPTGLAIRRPLLGSEDVVQLPEPKPAQVRRALRAGALRIRADADATVAWGGGLIAIVTPGTTPAGPLRAPPCARCRRPANRCCRDSRGSRHRCRRDRSRGDRPRFDGVRGHVRRMRLDESAAAPAYRCASGIDDVRLEHELSLQYRPESNWI